MRIVPLAAKNYFVYGIPIEKTIRENRDIFNFCMRLKTNSKSVPYFKHMEFGNIVEDQLDRTTRYYMGKGPYSGIIIKKFDEGKRVTGVNVGYSCILFNKYFKCENWDDYKIDYQFYIAEANKLKNPLVNKELDLFG